MFVTIFERNSKFSNSIKTRIYYLFYIVAKLYDKKKMFDKKLVKYKVIELLFKYFYKILEIKNGT